MSPASGEDAGPGLDGLSDRSNPNDAVPPPADVAASSPEAGDITPAAVSTGEAVSARGLAYARPFRPRVIFFAPISGHEERQRRLALAAQDVEVDVDPGARGEPPRRLSPVAHGDDALATRPLGARNL